ncbi:general odorant-binding protein 69a-like [Culicoides brevitarsis]|uniref:general odorant-binding protein 69a-like n=1 Tax=Culicoides brevitarsis TaxID=469753 RepID=UPI00307BA5B1
MYKKILLVAFFVGFGTNDVMSQEFHLDSGAIETMIEIRDRCLKKADATMEELKVCHDGTLPSDPKFKCFVACNLHEHNFLDDKGRFRSELLKIDYVRKIVGHCGEIEGLEYCENGYQVGKCLVEKLKLYDEICSLVAV